MAKEHHAEAKTSSYPENHLDARLMNRIIRHRLRNLCAGVKMTVERMAKTTSETHPQIASRCDVIVGELDNLREFTERMDLLFDALPASDPKTLFEFVSTLRDDFVKHHPLRSISLDGPEANTTIKSGSLALIAAGELLDNAGGLSEADGEVALSWTIDEGGLHFFVTNDGGPIANEIPVDPPEPFNTTRSRRDGLGLSIARRIAESIGGSLAVDGMASKRVTATLTLPPEELINE